MVEDLLYLVRPPAPLARSLLAMFVIMPLIVVLLARAFELPHAVEVALVALAVSPLPLLIPKKLTEQEGLASHSIALMATIALLSIVIAPLLLELLERYAARSLTLSPWRVAGVIATSVLLPLVAGMVFRAILPAQADRIELPLSIVGSVLLRLAALALFATTLQAIWALVGNGTIIAIAIFVVTGLAAGYLLGGPDRGRRTVLALATASRHPAIALAVAAADFAEEHFGATIALYLLVSAVVGLLYTMWQRKKARDVEAATAILEAQKKAIDDIQAGRPAPYYAIPPVVPAASQAAPSPPLRDTVHAVKKREG